MVDNVRYQIIAGFVARVAGCFSEAWHEFWASDGLDDQLDDSPMPVGTWQADEYRPLSRGAEVARTTWQDTIYNNPMIEAMDGAIAEEWHSFDQGGRSVVLSDAERSGLAKILAESQAASDTSTTQGGTK